MPPSTPPRLSQPLCLLPPLLPAAQSPAAGRAVPIAPGLSPPPPPLSPPLPAASAVFREKGSAPPGGGGAAERPREGEGGAGQVAARGPSAVPAPSRARTAPCPHRGAPTAASSSHPRDRVPGTAGPRRGKERRGRECRGVGWGRPRYLALPGLGRTAPHEALVNGPQVLLPVLHLEAGHMAAPGRRRTHVRPPHINPLADGPGRRAACRPLPPLGGGGRAGAGTARGGRAPPPGTPPSLPAAATALRGCGPSSRRLPPPPPFPRAAGRAAGT